ncbi:VirD4-like conjugal transfer protein, CD1115 family [Neomoorella mulderi]|uniref:Conjugal transfer protein TraG n=1 Tax=Moorella mulderi DSM 14980 TaxID=1122241 RepID=A0A151AT03_9FIRM|nr:type IV secretory system conjugative DNA transfer family protein [Moorella mulderi]KYH30769.1 conjugal transfer protein TraG [Moorella mulderi DSM 14980]
MKLKFRHVVLFLLILLDLLLAPLVLKLPLFLKGQGFKPGLEAWKKEVLARPLAGPAILLKDTKMRQIWIWLQPAFGAAAISILWPATRRKSKARDDIGGPEAAGQGQHGTARWRTRKEIAATLAVWRLPGGPPGGGVVMGFARQPFYTAWLDAGDTHVLLLGATRSGKSRRVIIPTILTLALAGESMVITDPKGELYQITSTYLQRRGYDVVKIDLRDPYRGNRWNPLEPVIRGLGKRDHTAASQAAWDMANIITHQQPHHGDSIWPQSQESLTAALALAVAAEALPEGKHLASAYALLTTLGAGGGEKLDAYFRRFPQDHPARAAYGVAALSEERLRSSIFTGTAAQLRLWADPAVAWLTAVQDHNLAGAGKKKTAVFLLIPDERENRHVLASLYIAQAYQALADAARGQGGLPLRVNFLLDEFGNLPPIPGFDKKLTVAAGRGMRFLLALQDLAQIKSRYKEAAGTITGNCATWVYLATADVETARVISAKTGQYTVRTESYSSQVRAASDYSSGTTEGLTGRPLLLPDEVLRWPKGEALVLQTGQNPARLPLADLSEWPVAGDLTPAATENPDRGVITAPPVWLPGPPAGGGKTAVKDDTGPDVISDL